MVKNSRSTHAALMVTGAAALAVCIVMGCGPAGPFVAPVEGTVTYQGKPVPKANIVFVPNQKNGMSAMGITDANGKYQLTTFGRNDGALVGSHKVSIVARAPFEGKVPPGMGAAYLEELETQGKPLIPEKYFSVEKSGLTAEVKNESNVLNFQLRE